MELEFFIQSLLYYYKAHSLNYFSVHLDYRGDDPSYKMFKEKITKNVQIISSTKWFSKQIL